MALGFAGATEGSTADEAITVQSSLANLKAEPTSGRAAPTSGRPAPTSGRTASTELVSSAPGLAPVPPVPPPTPPAQPAPWRLPPFPGPGAGLPNSSPAAPVEGRGNPFDDRFPPPVGGDGFDEGAGEDGLEAVRSDAPQWATSPTRAGEDGAALFAGAAFAPFAADAFPGGNSGDLPGLLPREAMDDGSDPFDVQDDSIADSHPGVAELPPVPPPARLAKIDLGQVAIPNFSDHDGFEATAIAAAYEEPRPSILKKELPLVGDRSGLWPSLLGALLGLGLVTLLLPDLGQRLLDRVSRRSADAFSRVNPHRILPESLQTLRALNTNVDGYRLASGHLVLVVRGTARNVGSTPVQGLSAVALAMDGGTVTARAMAPVGVILEPDALFALAGPGDVDGAYARRSAQQEGPIPPGGERPFMVVFPEVPPDAAERTFQVEFLPVEP